MSFLAKNAPIVITGATGNVGRAVVNALMARGQEVRVGSRGLRTEVWDAGLCEPVLLDFADPSTFGPALRGARGLFLMRPNPVLAVKKTLNRLLDVAAAEGIGHCVFLSVAGAEKNPLVPHHAVEQHLMAGQLSWTMMRAGFFMQNLTGPYLADIRDGTLVLPAGQGKVAYVDTRDLGELAAMILINPAAHRNKAYHLTGAEAFSFAQVAELLATELGRQMLYRPASLFGFWRHCRSRGLGAVPTLAYTIIHAALRGGSGAALDPILSQLLGRPSRTLRAFIYENRSIWV